MKTNNNIKPKRILNFFCVYLFLFLTINSNYMHWNNKTFSLLVIFIFGFSSLFILSMYLFKNIFFRIGALVVFSSIICLVDYHYLPFVVCPWILIYLYKTILVEKKANTPLTVIFFAISALLSLWGIINSIQNYRENFEKYARIEMFCYGFVFIILLCFVLITMHMSVNSPITKKNKLLYTILFLEIISGVLCSILTGNILITVNFRYNPMCIANLPLAPWYFFLLVFLYERDEVIYFFSFKIIEKIYKFLDPTKKLSKFKYYQK